MKCEVEWIDDPENRDAYPKNELYFSPGSAPDVIGLEDCRNEAMIQGDLDGVKVAVCVVHAPAFKLRAKYWWMIH